MEIPYTISTSYVHFPTIKGEHRVRVEQLVIVLPEPLTSILSPSARGEVADRSPMSVL